ncbi:zinc ribbon domain-containing protein [Peptoniphilus sp. KCTC 25270]|uniref:zinc ribbon domain-containing protein n=1 Tax=Peptoniphilus sp. KCTC 25270 TaxID=2897414 RepID=UPI001E312051|nr:zinc ribbon domain-containing protein [Peptoniphilus sp. KCTC 25270]MCD1146761.1 zinc ribbon domain-containing protein [Peptoniphilus sp. KCTC 25270]
MDLFTNIGKGIEELTKQAKDVGKRVNHGAKEASKQTKIKLQIKELEMELAQRYTELGKAYYLEMRSQSHKTETSSAEILLQLDQLHSDYEALENLLRFRELEAGDMGEKRCKNCHQLLSEEAKFCSACGTPVDEEEEMTIIEMEETKIPCPHCGFLLPSDASYCTCCGSKIR